MSERISAVFDCMMFLQAAARKESPAAACFDLVRLRHAELHISDEILSEVRNVFTYPKFRARFPTLTDEMIEEFLADVLTISKFSRNVPSEFTFERDPKDDVPSKILSCGGVASPNPRDPKAMSALSAC